MTGLLIRNGMVVDGTGAAARPADVRIKGRYVAEVGQGLAAEGETVIDAAGAVVAPGFIDSHTHYDATIFWDAACDPMPQHGVTTVVIGNCSLSLAPLRSGERDALLDVFSFIEDIPFDVLKRAVPWSWESYEDYSGVLDAGRYGVHLAALVGHAQIRNFVMGEAAWERAATPEEVAAMVEQLEGALRAGALGLSFSLFDKDRHGRRVPCCFADDAEMDALCAALARAGAIFQFVPRGDTSDEVIEDIERVARMIGPHGIVGLHNIVVHVDSDPERSGRILATLERLHAAGVRLYSMASPRPFELSIGFEGGLCLAGVPAWNQLVHAAPDEQRRLIADPEWRARARADVDEHISLLFPFSRPDELRIGTAAGAERQAWAGRTLADLVRERGGHVSDVLADWVSENDFATSFIFAIANTKPDEVMRLIRHPYTFVSGSDAGAHLQMFSAAGDGTLLLTRYVRDRHDLALEEAVHALTGRQAEVLGLGDRGVLEPGKVADVVVFDPAELSYGAEFTVADVPGGHSRLTRKPGGYRYTIANGEIVQKDGVLTGLLPAERIKRIATM